jgi:hypothetical protein
VTPGGFAGMGPLQRAYRAAMPPPPAAIQSAQATVQGNQRLAMQPRPMLRRPPGMEPGGPMGPPGSLLPGAASPTGPMASPPIRPGPPLTQPGLGPLRRGGGAMAQGLGAAPYVWSLR